MLAVRRALPTEADDCAEIIRSSPDYFTADVPGKVAAQTHIHPTWVVADGPAIFGFAVVDHRSAHAAEILWMAVTPSRRRKGAGTLLLDRVVLDLAAAGVQLIEVKTLDASAGYELYAATRTFWERSGFVQIDTIDPLPDWPPGNPAALYVAALSNTR